MFEMNDKNMNMISYWLGDSLPDYLIEFVKYKMSHTSMNTIRVYINNIRTFFFWLECVGRDNSLKSISSINERECNLFLSYLIETKNFSASTISSVFSTMNSFYSFMVKENIIDRNPFSKIKCPKRIKIKHSGLNEDEKNRFLHVVRTGENMPKRFISQEITHGTHARNVAIALLLLETKIKSSELISLNVDDVDFRSHCIVVKGKKISISVETETAILECIDMRIAIGVPSSEHALFIASQGKNKNNRISVQTVDTLIRKYTFAAGISDSRHFNSNRLRYTD